MVAPVLPYLTDSVEHLDGLLQSDRRGRGRQGHGVRPAPARIDPRMVHVVAGDSTYPQLVERYRELYRRGAYLPPSYRDELRARLHR